MIKKLLELLGFDTRTAQQVKFDKAREAKAERELIEDDKRNAEDHPQAIEIIK